VTGGLRANSSRVGFAYFYDGVCAPSTVQSVAVLNASTVVIDPPPRTVGQYLVCYSTTDGASWSTQLLFFAVQRKKWCLLLWWQGRRSCVGCYSRWMGPPRAVPSATSTSITALDTAGPVYAHHPFTVTGTGLAASSSTRLRFILVRARAHAGSYGVTG